MPVGKENLRARRDALARPRPLILDDDGDLVYDPRAAAGPAAFSQLRLADLVDTPVDSLAWCMMWGIARGGAAAVRYWQTQQEQVPLTDLMPDPTPVVQQFCRRHGIEVFGSIRMNDCHDAFGMPAASLQYPLKVEHPELLLGDATQRGGVEDGLPAAMWSGLDFAAPEVIEDRIWWIEHAATAYDLDGIDLNFFRMPWLFRPGQEQQHMTLMSDFVRRARRIAEQAGQSRGRPLLLGVRVFDTLEANLRLGLDVEAWLIEGLVDRLLAGGGYASFCQPVEEMIELGQRFQLPVYPCINCPGTFDLGVGPDGDDERGFEALRGAAANFWQAGADGIYLWNYQYLKTPHIAYGQPFPRDYGRLAELADPGRLAGLDKVFSVNPRPLEQYARASAPCPLPLPVVGSETAVSIRVGEDTSEAESVLLQLDLENVVAGDDIRVRLNDLTLLCEEGELVELPVHGEALRQGENRVEFVMGGRGELANYFCRDLRDIDVDHD